MVYPIEVPAHALAFTPPLPSCLSWLRAPIRPSISPRSPRTIFHLNLSALSGDNRNGNRHGGNRGGGGNGGGGAGGDGNRKGPFSTPLALYAYLLRTFAIPTKAVTTGLLSLLSDFAAQRMDPAVSIWDATRGLTFAASGMIVTAPMYHYVFGILESALPAISARNVAAQVALDQFVAAPVWLVLWAGVITALKMQTRGGENGNLGPRDIAKKWRTESVARIRREFWPVMRLTWTIYPVTQAANIALVPMQWRVAVMNIIDLVFTLGLSQITHRRAHA